MTTAFRPACARAEQRWAAVGAALVMLLTLLPYTMALRMTPPGRRFMGFLGNPDDRNAHLAWIRQAAEGHLLLENRYTTEPHSGRFFNLYFLALGRAARLFHLGPYLLYQLSRLVGGFLLLFLYFRVLCRALERRVERWAAFLLAAFSSGLGGFYLLATGMEGRDVVDVPPGLVVPEANTFLSLLHHPLFVVSMLLYLLAFYLGTRAIRERSGRAMLLAWPFALLLGGIHTYDMIPLYASLCAYALVRGWQRRAWPWQEILLALGLVLLSSPFVFYQYYLIQTDPIYAAKANTLTATPPPINLVISFGIPLLLALAGLPAAARREALTPFAVWLIVGLAVCYLPVPFQRKMLEGIHLPMCVLAGAGWTALERRLRAARRVIVRPVFALVFVFTLPSQGMCLIWDFLGLRDNARSQLRFWLPPPYLLRSEVEAMEWLDHNAPAGSAVLCAPLVGSYLPARTGCRVYAGHWAETLEFARKQAEVVQFFRDLQPAEAKAGFLRQAGITFILLGEIEQALNQAAVDVLPRVETVWQEGEVRILRVESEGKDRR